MTPPADPYRLDGKVAVVTGSGRGIGAAIALALGQRGAKVVVNYAHSAGPASQVVAAIQAAGSEAIAVKADVSDVAQTAALMDAAVARFGKLDIVSSNSGVVSFGHLKDVSEAEFDRVFAVNTRGQFFVAREAYKRMEGGGRIVLTSSNTATVKGVPNHSVYSGSKGAIETFVRCLVGDLSFSWQRCRTRLTECCFQAIDCGDKKITVNAVAPGAIKTDMFKAVSREYIPDGANFTEQQVDDVRLIFLLFFLNLLCSYTGVETVADLIRISWRLPWRPSNASGFPKTSPRPCVSSPATPPSGLRARPSASMGVRTGRQKMWIAWSSGSG